MNASPQSLSLAAQVPFEGIARFMVDCVVLLDIQGRICYANPAALQCLGCPGDPIGRALEDFWPISDAVALRHALQETHPETSPQLVVSRINTTGRPQWWEFSFSTLPDTQPARVLCLIRDVSQMHEAALVAHRQTLMLQAALEGGAFGSWTHDLETNTYEGSAKFREQAGLPPDGPINPHMAMARIVPEKKEAFNAARLKAIETPGVHRLEAALIDPQGQLRWLALYFCVEHRAGRKPMVFGISADFTAKQTLADSNLQAQAEIARLVEERTRMLSDLNAHTIARIEKDRKELASELHDELGSIATLMSMELVKAGQHLANNDAAALAPAIDHLCALVDRLREYKHRLISGLRPPLLQELGLELAVRVYAEEFCTRSNLKLTLDFIDPLPPLKEDAALALFRASQEALTNTVKYAAATEVSIVFQIDGGNIELEIIDNGGGIACGHSGYGLVAMRERMQTLGGTARFDRVSEAGGTRIAVAIPMAPNVQEERP